MMKILIVVESLCKGGRERRIIELLKGLAKYDDIHCEVVIFRDIVEYKEIYTLNVPLHLVQRRSKNDLTVFPRFYKLLKQIKPDIVHSWGGLSSMISLPSAKILGIKTMNAMITNSEVKLFSKSWIRSRFTFPFSDIIASNSKAGLKAYRPPSRKSVLIYNGFSPGRLQSLRPVEETKMILGVHTPKMVVMVGAFQPRKDYKTYITMAIDLLKTRNDVTFLAVGDGFSMELVKSYVPEVYKHKVLFTGNRSDVESIANAMDVGILTTNNKGGYAEGISNAILEYMALGKPVIATNDGGTPEIVSDGITGYLIPGNDPCMLASKLNYLLDNPGIANDMGQKGKEIVFKSFTIDKMVEKTYQTYQILINKSK